MAPRENSDWQLECGAIRERGARLLASEQWADCSFLLGRDRTPVKAHRLILAMASPVFEAMFYGPIAEGDAPIRIPDIRPVIFKKLLQYVYTDGVDLDDCLIAIEVYYTAQKYMLPHLLKLCTIHLSSNVVPQNACRIYEFANFIENEKLQDKSLMVIKKNTKLALSDSSFEDLAPGTVVNIFAMDDITIDSELDLLAAAERYFLAMKLRIRIRKFKNLNLTKILTEIKLKYHFLTMNMHIFQGSDEESGVNQENYSVPNNNEESNVADKVTCNGENEESMSSSDKPLDEELTIRFTVKNFSKVKDTVCSPPYYICGLPWKIMLMPKQDGNGQKKLGLFLQCNGDSKSITWLCKARIEFRLISQKSNTKPYTMKTEHVFFSKENDWGYPTFIAWKRVLDRNEGYIKNNTITVEAHVIAEPPVFSDSKKHSNNVDMLAQAVMSKIRFLSLTGKEFAEYESKMSLLSERDKLAIMMHIVSTGTKISLPNWVSRSRARRTPPKP